MKKSLVISTFAVVAAGTAGVGAIVGVQMHGSDTLGAVTIELTRRRTLARRSVRVRRSQSGRTAASIISAAGHR
jgi:hypothetical protein